jgi:hypothetical protein
VLLGAGASEESASRCPAPDQPLERTPEATGERADQSSRQLGAAEGRQAYATVVAGAASLQKPSGPLKSTAKGSASAEPTASLEAATRRMSRTDMSGPLSGMSDGATPNAHVATTKVDPIGERPNKTPIFNSSVGSDARSFLAWLRASCPGDLTAQLKSDKLMVVPSTADGFRAAVSALRSLDGGKGVSFHTFTLPEDRCVRLLVKKLGRGMPESVVREELESLDIRVQGVTQLRSGRRDKDPARDGLPTPHFIVSVARGPEVSRMRAITELCCLRVSVESYVAPKGPLQCRRCQRFGHTQRNCGYAPRCVACGGSHLSGGCFIPRERPLCCLCGGTTQRTTGAALSGRRGLRLPSRRPIVAARAPPQLVLPLRRNSGQGHLLSSWTWAKGGTTLSEGGVLSRHQLHILLPRNPPSRSQKPTSVLK